MKSMRLCWQNDSKQVCPDSLKDILRLMSANSFNFVSIASVCGTDRYAIIFSVVSLVSITLYYTWVDTFTTLFVKKSEQK